MEKIINTNSNLGIIFNKQGTVTPNNLEDAAEIREKSIAKKGRIRHFFEGIGVLAGLSMVGGFGALIVSAFPVDDKYVRTENWEATIVNRWVDEDLIGKDGDFGFTIRFQDGFQKNYNYRVETDVNYAVEPYYLGRKVNVKYDFYQEKLLCGKKVDYCIEDITLK